MPAGETKFFVSYAREDQEFALRLAKHLRAAGANLWVDHLDIQPGARWDTAIEAALDSCGGMLIILSPDAVASENVKDELGDALDKGKRVVPVVVRECKIPLRLRRVQYIDVTAAGEEAGMAQVLEVIAGRERGDYRSARPNSASSEVGRAQEQAAPDQERRAASPATEDSVPTLVGPPKRPFRFGEKRQERLELWERFNELVTTLEFGNGDPQRYTAWFHDARESFGENIANEVDREVGEFFARPQIPDGRVSGFQRRAERARKVLRKKLRRTGMWALVIGGVLTLSTGLSDVTGLTEKLTGRSTGELVGLIHPTPTATLVSIPATSPERCDGPLINGSFEEVDDSTGWPRGWVAFGNSGPAIDCCGIDAVVVNSGSRSAKVSLGSPPSVAGWIQKVRVCPNRSYRLSGWIRAQGVQLRPESLSTKGAILKVDNGDDPQKRLWETDGSPGTYDWHHFAVPFTTGDKTSVDISVQVGDWAGDATGTAWFDDLQFQRVE